MGIDYSSKMNDLIFTYDKDYYPLDENLPDPQIDPILPGARVPIQKVGIAPVDMPIYVKRKDGDDEKLLSQASLYCSLDDPEAKGLNLSRFYLLMHERMAEKDALGSMQDVLKEMASKQGSNNAYVKLRFKYPWLQKALRTRKFMLKKGEQNSSNSYLVDDEHGKYLEDGTWISHKKMEGHIAYNVEFEGRYHGNHYEHHDVFKYYLTVDYIYSSTCPCSFELAHDAKEKRNAAANSIQMVMIQRLLRFGLLFSLLFLSRGTTFWKCCFKFTGDPGNQRFALIIRFQVTTDLVRLDEMEHESIKNSTLVRK